MSFQGDVGGIGLAELLQSLARGRREGTLTLIGKEGLRSTLGVDNGVLLLLPEPDEDPEVWRGYARRAYADRQDTRVDALQMSEIARARRIETLYKLLDSEGVHFRFNPGPLPERDTGNEERAGQVYCEGTPVEFLLLEYARLADETGSHPPVEDGVVPRALDLGSAPEEVLRFLSECDGASDLQEIADRLGWPERQVRNAFAGERALGRLRETQPREMLALVIKELQAGQTERAADRLERWLDIAQPGPPAGGDGDLLAGEWKAGRLPRVLPYISASHCRTLLRRMQVGRYSAADCITQWREIQGAHRTDKLTELRILVLSIRDEDDPDQPQVRDLMTAARQLRDGGNPRRSVPFLRLAAEQNPTNNGVRVDLGQGLLVAGLPEEGVPWILEAANYYIEQEEFDKAFTPLRNLLEICPRNREARRLMTRCRNHSVKRRVVKRHSLIGFATLLALAVGAWVQIHVEREADRKLGEIQSRLDQPEEALRLLELHFSEDETEEVQALRESIFERRRAVDNELRAKWNDAYREAMIECTLGDQLIGLRRALDLPEPPELTTSKEPWPLTSDLFNGIIARLEDRIKELGAPEEDTTTEVHAEEKLSKLVENLEELAAENAEAPHVDLFRGRLKGVVKLLVDRGEARARAISARAREATLAAQNETLAIARAHAAAGDLNRAMTAYEKLLSLDEDGKLGDLTPLREEIDDVRRQRDALVEARSLAQDGHHEQARELMLAELEAPYQYLVPWKIDTFPQGARVRLSDGTVHTTPFELSSTLDEKLDLVLELEGHETIQLTMDGPADRHLYFSRTPELQWRTDSEVDAPPVSVEQDYVVCDRSGNIARIASGGSTVWEKKLRTLGGIARTPAFMTGRSGHLLALTEEGEVWIIASDNGELEGPWAMGSPPSAGPIARHDGVVARFHDGTCALWNERQKPARTWSAKDPSAPELSGGPDDPGRYGSSAGLSLMRREASSDTYLNSPWHDLVIEIHDERFTVLRRSTQEPLFTVRRRGEWQFLAWEASRAGVPLGRLWISDGEGLRAFQP